VKLTDRTTSYERCQDAEISSQIGDRIGAFPGQGGSGRHVRGMPGERLRPAGAPPQPMRYCWIR
jgi:hypothetical protein